MPNKQKRPPGGANGPQGTRVYAPTHRSMDQASGGRGASTGASSSAKRENSAIKSKQANAGQASGRPRSSSNVAGKHGGATPADRQTSARRSPEKSSGLKQTRFNPDLTKERLAAQAKAQLAGKAESDAASKAPREEKQTGSGKHQKGFSSIHRLEHVGAETAKNAKKKEKPKRKPLNRKKLMISLIAGVAASGLLLLGYFVFLLDTVAVDGNETYSDASIVELSGLHAGTHLLLCNVDEAKAGIEANPYLKVISIRRELPRTVRISVKERKEVAAIAGQGYDVIIDSEGYVLSIGAGSDLSGLLRVSGMSQIGFHVNQKLGANSDLQTQTLLDMIEQLAVFDLLKDVAELDLSNPLNVCLYTRDGITVTFGQPDDIPGKLAWMRDVLPSLQAGGITNGTLDVSAKGGPIYSPAGSGNVSPTPDQGDEPEPGNPGDDVPQNENSPQPSPTQPVGEGEA